MALQIQSVGDGQELRKLFNLVEKSRICRLHCNLPTRSCAYPAIIRLQLSDLALDRFFKERRSLSTHPRKNHCRGEKPAFLAITSKPRSEWEIPSIRNTDSFESHPKTPISWVVMRWTFFVRSSFGWSIFGQNKLGEFLTQQSLLKSRRRLSAGPQAIYGRRVRGSE